LDLPTHRVAANVYDFSWAAVRRSISSHFFQPRFSPSPTSPRKKPRAKFLSRLKSVAAQRAVGAYPAAGEGQRAFYLLVLRPGVDLAQLLPNVSPLQRELDVVLLHEGILEPALGITMQAVTKEANLTYEREATNALNAVDSGGAQIAFFLNACDVEKVVEIGHGERSDAAKVDGFFSELLSGITMYRV